MGLVEQTEGPQGTARTAQHFQQDCPAELQLLWAPSRRKPPTAVTCGTLCPALPCVPPVLHFAPCACGQQVSYPKTPLHSHSGFSVCNEAGRVLRREQHVGYHQSPSEGHKSISDFQMLLSADLIKFPWCAV